MENDEFVGLDKDIAAYNLSLLDWRIYFDREDKIMGLTADVSNSVLGSLDVYLDDSLLNDIGLNKRARIQRSSDNSTISVFGEDGVQIMIDNGILPDKLEALCIRVIRAIEHDRELENKPVISADFEGVAPEV